MTGRYLYAPEVHHCGIPPDSAPERALWECDCGRIYRGLPRDQRDGWDSGWRRCSRWRANRILKRAARMEESSGEDTGT